MFFARLPTHTREHQPERIVYMEMSPVEIEPTTYCLGEMLTASPPENCTAL